MKDFFVVSEETGEPLIDERGMPVAWSDIIAAVVKYADENGYELETAVNDDGEDMFRLVKKVS